MHLLQCSVYEAVLGVHDGSFAVFASLFLHAPGGFVAVLHYLRGIGERFHQAFCLLVVLQQFYGKVACGVFLRCVGLLVQVFLNFGNAVFNLVSVVYVNVPVERCIALFVLAVLYDGLEQLPDAPSRCEDGRHHGHSQQHSQFLIVYVVATVFHLVVHVQGAYHGHVHVYELRGKVEVAFQVRCVYHVDDDVRRLVHELFAHVELFRAVCREAVCARQVYQFEVVAHHVGVAVLGIYGNARVVSHPLVRPRGEVEERRLAAVGVAHECHVYGVELLVVSFFFFVGCQCRLVGV